MRRATLFTLVLLSLLLSGCQTVPMGPYISSLDNIERVQRSGIAPLKVGEFALAPGKPAGMDQSVSARSITLSSPNGNSFAQYLRESLITELKNGGKYSEQSPITVKGWLTENQLEGGGAETNRGSLGARFVLVKEGATVFDKEFLITNEWPSGFVGVEAIPKALNEYTLFYRKLFIRLFEDEGFKKAAR